MKKALAVLAASTLLLSSTIMTEAENIFSRPFDTVHGTVPFSKIDDSQWMPAIDAGIAAARQEIDAITKNRARPDFDNTIVPLEQAGEDLDRVLNIFYPLLSANATDAMMQTAMEASAKLSDYSTSIVLDEQLWKRVEEVYNNRDMFDLSPEESMLLQKTYDSFALSGATLKGADRERYRELSSELSALTTTFGQNVLKEMNTYE
ncbi:MAG: peptidase M3, partial [Muribaculaceae bacterium]|nr:peptidase M3 [Muribaculaceae bacterium]